MNLNKAFIIGNLTRDPEIKTLPSGQPVVNFGVATNRRWTDPQGTRQEHAEFHNIVAFGKLAELCSQYLSKGRVAMIEGRLQTRSWQDQKSGDKRYRTEIVAENVQFGAKPAGAAGSYQRSAISSTDQPKSESREPDAAPAEDLPIIQEDEPEIEVKDIPF